MLGYLITVLVLTIVFALLLNHSVYDDWNVDLGAILSGLIISMFVSFYIIVIASGVISPKIEYVVDYEQPILALQDNSLTNGHFFLGSGTIGSAMKYVYLAKQDDGVVLKTVDTNNVVIMESSDTPKIIVYKSQFVNDVWRNILFNFNGGRTKFSIPKNSIKYNYNVDLR